MRRRIPKVFVTLLLSFIFAHSALAIVNVETLRARAGSNEGWSSAGSLNASGTSGNSDKSSVSISGLLQLLRPNYSNLIVIGSEYGEASGNKNADKQVLHLRHTRNLSVRTAWEAFTQWQQNEFTRLEERSLLGSGFRFRFGNGETRTLNLGVGGFYESERNENEATMEIGRSNLYASFKSTLSSGASFVSTVYLQNKLDELSDKRSIGNFSFSVPFAEHLEFVLNVSVEHDSRPPVGIEKTDWSYKTGIGWKF